MALRNYYSFENEPFRLGRDGSIVLELLSIKRRPRYITLKMKNVQTKITKKITEKKFDYDLYTNHLKWILWTD